MQDSPEENALNAALRLLEAGDKSRKELSERLRRKKFSGDVIEKTLSRLEAKGFVDDRRFAARLSERLGGRGASQRKMAFEMRRRGVPAEWIEEELNKTQPEEDSRLEQAGLRQWNRLKRLEAPVRFKRAFAALARQGFDPEPIRRFLDRMLREENNRVETEFYDDHG